MKTITLKVACLSALMTVGSPFFLGCSHKSTGPSNRGQPYTSITFAEGAKPHVVMETSLGRMVFELWPDNARENCQNFVYLSVTGFYDSLTIHRVVPGFVIQGGDPKGNGTGGPGYTVPAEFSAWPLVLGTLAMARGNDINSAGSQFFVCLGRLTSLDGKYTVIGQIIDGLDVLRAIERVPIQGERPDPPVYLTRVYAEFLA